MDKKKYGIVAGVAAILIIIGVVFAVKANNDGKKNYEKNQYDMAMDTGKDFVKNKDYSAAEQNFKNALSIKPDDIKATAYSEQAESFDEAMDDIKDYEFDDAIDNLDDVISETNGYSVMSSQARKLSATLTEVNDNIENQIEPLVDQAEDAEDNRDYAFAISAYDEVLNLDYIEGKYYKRIFQEVTAARTQAENMSKSQESSSASSSSSSNSMNTEGIQPSDKEVDGKEITTTMIANARAQMKALGTNPGPWSNLDISRLIQLSAKNGHTQITQEDIDQYLK